MPEALPASSITTPNAQPVLMLTADHFRRLSIHLIECRVRSGVSLSLILGSWSGDQSNA